MTRTDLPMEFLAWLSLSLSAEVLLWLWLSPAIVLGIFLLPVAVAGRIKLTMDEQRQRRLWPLLQGRVEGIFVSTCVTEEWKSFPGGAEMLEYYQANLERLGLALARQDPVEFQSAEAWQIGELQLQIRQAVSRGRLAVGILRFGSQIQAVVMDHRGEVHARIRLSACAGGSGTAYWLVQTARAALLQLTPRQLETI